MGPWWQAAMVSEADAPARAKIWGFLSLLGSGVLAAVGFMLIASRRWPFFEPHLAAYIILFVQWQTLGLTLAKLGVENVVFAVVSSDRNKYFVLRHFLIRKAMPLALLFSIAVWWVFSPWAAVVAWGSILLDTASLIIMADLNARGRYHITSLSNLFNYPLFFAILACVSFLGEATRDLSLAAFLAASVMRWLWLVAKRFVPVQREEVSCVVNLEMGAQQILNYLLFRSDQLLISFFLLTTLAAEKLGMYVYLAKFPEITAGVVLVAGAVYFPGMYIQYGATGVKSFGLVKKYLGYLPAYILVLVVAVMMYRWFWHGPALQFSLVLPFLLHALLVLIVNNVTYSMLRQGYMSGLLRNLTVSVVSGLCYAAAVVGSGSTIYALAWLVPIQMCLFLLLSLWGSWGKRTSLYA